MYGYGRKGHGAAARAGAINVKAGAPCWTKTSNKVPLLSPTIGGSTTPSAEGTNAW
jgi:hypothetical protein